MNIAIEYEWTLHDFQVELRSEALARDVLERRSTDLRPSDRAAIVVNSKDALDIRPCVESLIHSARERIIIEHCYHSDPRVLTLVAEATHRGVSVTILTPRDPEVNGHANRSALKELKRQSDTSRLTILEYPKRFHTKLMLVDGHSCLLGSANLNSLSLDRTGEVCVLLTQGSRAVRKIERRLQLDVFRSSIITVSKLDLVRRILGKLGFVQ